MTVVASPVHQPTLPEVFERECRARILEAAALEIEVRGWTQGTWCNGGSVCIRGALVAACNGDPTQHNWASFADADYAAIDAWSADGEAYKLAEWNDHPDRTAAEVTFLLRWRAAEIRAGL